MPEASWGGDSVWDFINQWTSGTEIDLNVVATPQNLGGAVAGAKRIVTKLLVRHAGTNNTVVSLIVGGVTRESFDGGVVVTYHVIVAAALNINPILCSGKLIHKIGNRFAGTQSWVIFHNDQ